MKLVSLSRQRLVSSSIHDCFVVVVVVVVVVAGGGGGGGGDVCPARSVKTRWLSPARCSAASSVGLFCRGGSGAGSGGSGLHAAFLG